MVPAGSEAQVKRKNDFQRLGTLDNYDFLFLF